MTTLNMAHVVVRAAFDVGSGSIKLTVSKVDVTTNTVVEILFAEETEVLLGHDFKQSNDGQLGGAILHKATDAIARYKQLAHQKYGAQQFAGIATAVFRESTNGPSFIDSIKETLGIPLEVIGQDEEGRLGFLTAVATCGTTPPSQIISWDSGGASFQICALDGSDLETSPLHVFQGHWGSSKVTCAIIEQVQGRPFSEVQTCNPATMNDVEQLSLIIRESLPPPPAWLSHLPQRSFIAIGGATCMFRIVQLATDSYEYTPQDVWRAIEAHAGKTDTQLSHLPQPEMVIPKLTLCHAVMTAFGIARVRYNPCNGSTSGVMVSKKYWERSPHHDAIA